MHDLHLEVLRHISADAARYMGPHARLPADKFGEDEDAYAILCMVGSSFGKHATHHAAYCMGMIDSLPGPCPTDPSSNRAHDFVDLPGPASVIRLKEACGPFSAAKILRGAMQEGDLAQAMEGWVLMQP